MSPPLESEWACGWCDTVSLCDFSGIQVNGASSSFCEDICIANTDTMLRGSQEAKRQATCGCSDHNPSWGPSCQLASSIQLVHFKLPQLTWVAQRSGVPEPCPNCKIQIVSVASMTVQAGVACWPAPVTGTQIWAAFLKSVCGEVKGEENTCKYTEHFFVIWVTRIPYPSLSGKKELSFRCSQPVEKISYLSPFCYLSDSQ